jgi:murein DD-endopeptidase MepM/ murein hydrolase activator NlpD
MSRRITLLVTSSTGAPVRKISLSKRALWVTGFLVSVCLIFGTVVLVDYGDLQRATLEVRHLSRVVAGQEAELSGQEERIRGFVSQINTLKMQLSALHQFEQKIRIIANMESDADADNLFGVGGTIPEDIDMASDMEERHSTMLREMHAQLNILDAAFSQQREGFSSLLEYLEDKRKQLASTPAIRPINGGWITSRFEYRKSPFTGRREFHQGLDIAARAGTPVVASADGVVIVSGRKGSLGNAIMIDHGNGVISRYGHLTECLKRQGATVRREEIIGTVGNSGLSTGPHLHYEIRINGVAVNPEKYILN